jgi:hypothetical protein
MAHTCNPSYSGDRDQEDPGLKSAPTNSWRNPIEKNPSLKGWWQVAQDVDPEFKPQYHKKKKKDIFLKEKYDFYCNDFKQGFSRKRKFY